MNVKLLIYSIALSILFVKCGNELTVKEVRKLTLEEINEDYLDPNNNESIDYIKERHFFETEKKKIWLENEYKTETKRSRLLLYKGEPFTGKLLHCGQITHGNPDYAEFKDGHLNGLSIDLRGRENPKIDELRIYKGGFCLYSLEYFGNGNIDEEIIFNDDMSQKTIKEYFSENGKLKSDRIFGYFDYKEWKCKEVFKHDFNDNPIPLYGLKEAKIYNKDGELCTSYSYKDYVSLESLDEIKLKVEEGLRKLNDCVNY